MIDPINNIIRQIQNYREDNILEIRKVLKDWGNSIMNRTLSESAILSSEDIIGLSLKNIISQIITKEIN